MIATVLITTINPLQVVEKFKFNPRVDAHRLTRGKEEALESTSGM
jgi:hypothetical protein